MFFSKTLHDLMDEEEIEELSQEDTEKSKAEQKRKEFEEKLEREAKERQRKKLQAHQMMQEAEQVSSVGRCMQSCTSLDSPIENTFSLFSK